MDRLNTDQNTDRCRAGSLRRYYVRYTFGFCIMAVLVFSVYLFSGKTLIWNADAWSQHYKAFVYYAHYLRSIVRTLIGEGRLVIPNWEFGLGEGGDVLTTLHYYVIGDPLTALSVFVPTAQLHIFFDFLSILRLYLAGAVFSYFCFFMGQKNARAVAVGSFTYVFSYWAILNVARHPFFLNPMLYFPILLIGFEIVLRRGRPYLLIFAVALSAISNFYFFYMLAVISAFYVVCRLVYSVRSGETDVKTAVASLCRIACSAILGVVLAAIVLLPMCMAYLSDSRAGVDYAVGLLYPLRYYTALPGLIAGEGGGDYWICAGFSVVTFPCIIIMFRNRGHGLLKFFAAASVIALCIPFFGHLLNGFSYVTNRWSWAVAMIAAYAVTVSWDKLTDISVGDYVRICIGEGVLLVLCLIFGESRTLGAMASLALAFILLIILAPRTNLLGRPVLSNGARRCAAMILACVSIVVNSICLTAPGGNNYASEHVASAGILRRLYNNETAYIKALAEESGDDGFFRYSGPNVTQNAGTITGLSSTQFFWSLSTPSITERNIELGLRDYWLFRYSGSDGRTTMNTLASVRYYVTTQSSKAPVPYGFELITSEQTGPYQIYENKNTLPLAYTYDTVISPVVWDMLSAAEKEEAMLYGAYIGDSETELSSLVLDETMKSESLPYTVRCRDEGVSYDEGKFVVATPGSSVTIAIDRVPDSELYISFSGFSFIGTPEYDLYLGDDDIDPNGVYGKEMWDELALSERWQILQDKIFWTEPDGVRLSIAAGLVTNTLSWYGSGYQFYNGRDDFTVNLGYHDRGVMIVTVTFSKAGTYTFDKMELISRSVKTYSDDVERLKADTLDDLTVGTDTVSGSITLSEPKLLLFSIPYSEGWRAYVDGEETELCRANISYMAVRLDAGEHTVELRYDTPYLRTGACISAVGVCATAALIAVSFVKRRKIKSEKEA